MSEGLINSVLAGLRTFSALLTICVLQQENKIANTAPIGKNNHNFQYISIF